jgi:hypothetical protein
MRRICLALSSLVVGCTSSSPESAAPTKTVDAPASKEPSEPAAVPSPPALPTGGPTDPCGEKIAAYLAARAELSYCEADSDCAEMWPGLCPHGPYYIHRDADVGRIIELERTIMAHCEVPECEPPMELGIAHCENGRCAKSRTAPPASDHESCWDYRETWLEANGATSGTTSKHLQGITPHIGIAPADNGLLVLEIDWPSECSNCRLLISEHNSGMSKLIEPKSTRTQAERNGAPVARERLEFPVKTGPYHTVALADADADFVIRADLRNAAGEPGRVTRHGVGWQRMCEG